MLKVGQTWMCSTVPSGWKGLIRVENLVKITKIENGKVYFTFEDGTPADCTQTMFLSNFVKWASE